MVDLEKRKRVRFSPKLDICLLKEVVNVNPYACGLPNSAQNAKWAVVADAISGHSSKLITPRTAKERTALLIKAFTEEALKNHRKSGNEAEYEERDRLLQKLLDLQQNTDVAAMNEATMKPEICMSAPQFNVEEMPVETDLRLEVVEDIENTELDEFTETTSMTEESCTFDVPELMPEEDNTSQRRKRKRHLRSSDGIGYLKQRAQDEFRMREKELEIKMQEIAVRQQVANNETRRLVLQEQQFELEKKRFELEEKERNQKLELEARRAEHQMQMDVSREQSFNTLLSMINSINSRSGVIDTQGVNSNANHQIIMTQKT